MKTNPVQLQSNGKNAGESQNILKLNLVIEK